MTIFERVHELELPTGQYVVAGGAMEAHGIRQARDVDLIATNGLIDELLDCGWKIAPLRKGDTGIDGKKRRVEKPGGDVQINSEFSWQGVLFATTEVLIVEADIIEEIPFIALERIITWKQARARKKDLADIELIANFFKNKANHP